MAATKSKPTRSRSSTSSKQSAKTAQPNSHLQAFQSLAAALVTENGGQFELQPWQLEVLTDYFNGATELLVLLPKGNGKTTLFAAISIFHLLSTPEARCYIAAASRDQATLLYDHARGFVRRTPALAERLDVKSGYREIRSRSDSGFVKVLASDVDTVDGVGPTLALTDELHRHKTPALYQVFRDGLPKRNGQLCTISTAGHSMDTPLGRMRQSALELPDITVDDFHRRAASESGDFVMHEWSVPLDQDTSDIEIVKRANPSAFVSVESLRRRLDSPSMREGEWKRYAANQWVSYDEQWISPEVWAACGERNIAPAPGAEIYIGVDVGLVHDSTAVAIGWKIDGTEMVGLSVHVWAAMEEASAHVYVPGGKIKLSAVEDYIRELAKTYQVQEIVYDPRFFERSAEILGNEGLRIAPLAAASKNMHDAYQSLYSAAREGLIRHPIDSVFTDHVSSTTATATSRGWKIGRISHDRRIDGCVAAVMAHWRAWRASGEQRQGFLIT